MPMLDDLSGFEFEDLVEDVFRNLGYENVRQSRRTGDEGRDVLMEEVVDGARRAVVVECKHRESVSRPTVQKLHSAVATFDYDGPKRGMVVTTGRFTEPAREYAEKVGGDGDRGIELVGGRRLREIGEEVGLDLYNGRIEVLCDETLRPYDPVGGVHSPVYREFEEVQNIDADGISEPTAHVDLVPVLEITAEVDAVFETSVGVVHRIDDRSRIVVEGRRSGPQLLDPALARLLDDHRSQAVSLDDAALAETFDGHEIHRYGQTETEYKEWAVERLRSAHTTTVQYTGDNNVDYDKTCEPRQSDVSVQSIVPTYLPRVRQVVELGEYSYPLEYYAAGPSRETIENGIRRCVHCDEMDAGAYTYCANCGSVNCPGHTETERLTGDPVCTGCAVTERFAFSRKYFYDEGNLEAFREEYEEWPLREKAMENRPLVATSVLATVVAILLVLSSMGMV